MNDSKKIICIIPARKGSKGIPKKNIINFLGKPLISHSINYAKSSSLIHKIYVSTDCDQIAEIASKNEVEVIKRPDSISDDFASTESAMIHAVKSLNYKPDVIVLLQPTSPIRPNNSLSEALNSYLSNDFDCLLSISPTHRFFWEIDDDIAIPKYNFKKRPRRQDIKKCDIKYIENGSLYITSYDNLLKNKNRLGGKIGYIIFDEIYSHEIDSLNDLKFLESIAKDLNDTRY